MRTPIQIAITQVENTYQTQCHAMIAALCDDGTIWLSKENGGGWFPHDQIPQDDLKGLVGQPKMDAGVADVLASDVSVVPKA